MKKRTYQPRKESWLTDSRQLDGVDAVFDAIDTNPQLPTFSEFFVTCLLMGTAESVNLKQLFPELYQYFTDWLKSAVRQPAQKRRSSGL